MIDPTHKVSIIITCYNYGRFVSDAISSALAQTYPDIEVIVVNDGSTDDSHKVISQYLDKIHYINQKNQGAAQARNNGVSVATGDFCICLDGDDWISPNYIADAVELIEDKYTIVTPYSHFTNENLEINGDRWPHVHEIKQKLSNHILIYNAINPCSLFSKYMWLVVEGYNCQTFRAEDWIFWIDLINAGCNLKFLDANIVYYKYRKHGPSRSNTASDESVIDYVYNKYGIFNPLFNRKDKVNALYQLILNRPADIDGLNHYTSSNLSLIEIRTVLFHSEEYCRKNNYAV